MRTEAIGSPAANRRPHVRHVPAYFAGIVGSSPTVPKSSSPPRPRSTFIFAMSRRSAFQVEGVALRSRRITCGRVERGEREVDLVGLACCRVEAEVILRLVHCGAIGAVLARDVQRVELADDRLH